MTQTHYKMSCGCTLPILDSKIKTVDGLPSIDIDFYNLKKDCGHTWALIGRGLTKGVFQLEKSLGQHWSSKIQPISISELSAVISLIRPGTLEAKTTTEFGEKSLTQLYVDRRNGIEPITYLDPILEGILEETLAVLCYQEQSMKIAVEVAGFTEQEADSVRKSLGKKDANLMSKVKTMFIDGVKKKGIITEEVGVELFDWIEKGQRYLFNKSHAVSYAMMGYQSAYVKCLSPETIVETNEGYKNLDEIRVGDYVLAPSDVDESDEFVEVVDKFDNGIQDLYEVTLESGRTIECTIEHKFLCEDGSTRPLCEIIELDLKIMCQDD